MSFVPLLQIGMLHDLYELATAAIVFSQEFIDRTNDSIRIALQGNAEAIEKYVNENLTLVERICSFR